MKHKYSQTCWSVKALLFVGLLLSQPGIAIGEQTLHYTYDELGRLTFVEDSLNGNRDYDYDAAGNRTTVAIGNSSDDINAPQPPDAPTGLVLNGPFSQSGGYSFSWSAVSGADHYEIQLTDGTRLTTTATSGDTAGPAAEWVRAVNDAGASGLAYFGESNAPPATPTNLHLERRTDDLYYFSWSPVDGATHYEVQMESGTLLSISNNGSSSEEPAVWVRAVNVTGASANVEFGPVDIHQPWAPTGLTYIQTSSGYRFTWDAPQGADSYLIRLRNGATYTTTNTHWDAGSLADSVKAVNEGGESLAAYFYYLATPTGLTTRGPLSPYGGGYEFLWNAVEGATHYEIRLRDGSRYTTTSTTHSTAGEYLADWVRAHGDGAISAPAYFGN
jgi:YD repeat-containing protein